MANWMEVRSTPTTKFARGPIEERVEIDTREGTVVAEPGDFVMLEEDGEKYPISAEKFEEYYEVTEDVESLSITVKAVNGQYRAHVDGFDNGTPPTGNLFGWGMTADKAVESLSARMKNKSSRTQKALNTETPQATQEK